MSLLVLSPIKKTAGTPAWTPAMLSPISWYRADTVVTSGSNVTQWTDKSGNGHHATVTTGTSPTSVSSVINGKPVVRFVQASNQWLEYASTAVLADKNTAVSVIIITKGASATPAAGFSSIYTYGTAHTGSTAVDACQTFLFSNTGGYGQMAWGGGDNTAGNLNVATFNFSSAFIYLQFIYNGGGQFVNASNWTVNSDSVGQTIATSASAFNSNHTANYIGAYAAYGGNALPMDGDIAEIILCPTISGPNQTQLDAYILARYGLA